MPTNLRRLIGWEGLLLCILALVVVMNTNLAPAYLSLAN
jgi:rhamnose transport system permease protein